MTKNKLDSLVVKDIKITGESALVYTQYPGETDYIPYTFNFENDSWKLNILSEFERIEVEISNPNFKAKYGTSKTKFIESISLANKWNDSSKNLWLPQP